MLFVCAVGCWRLTSFTCLFFSLKSVLHSSSRLSELTLLRGFFKRMNHKKFVYGMKISEAGLKDLKFQYFRHHKKVPPACDRRCFSLSDKLETKKFLSNFQNFYDPKHKKVPRNFLENHPEQILHWLFTGARIQSSKISFTLKTDDDQQRSDAGCLWEVQSFWGPTSIKNLTNKKSVAHNNKTFVAEKKCSREI